MANAKLPALDDRRKIKVQVRCKCGASVDEVSSYFGVPLHRRGDSYRVCPAWSGV